MGEIADAILNGLFCEVCGSVMPDHEEPGYPRTCPDCQKEEDPYNGDIVDDCPEVDEMMDDEY